jgi:hypothetical protein
MSEQVQEVQQGSSGSSGSSVAAPPPGFYTAFEMEWNCPGG